MARRNQFEILRGFSWCFWLAWMLGVGAWVLYTAIKGPYQGFGFSQALLMFLLGLGFGLILRWVLKSIENHLD